MLADGLRVLQWDGDEREELEQTQSAWVSHVARALGGALGELERTQSERADRILELLGRADERTLRWLLLEPETSSRVLFEHSGHCDQRDLWTYLVDVLESALRDSPGDHRTATAPRTVAGLAIDTDSPAATCFDTSTVGSPTAERPTMTLRHYADVPAKLAVIAKVEQAMRALDATDAGVAAFARRFTVVLHLVRDASSTTFSSGSVGDYVGRSIFCNAHLPTVDIAVLAESLVHEAIHSLLSMYEAQEPWFLEAASFSADFVWFDLAHFWTIAHRSSPFLPAQVETRVGRAQCGFLGGSLVAHLGDLRPFVAPPLLELVAAMQQDMITLAATSG